MENFFFLSGTLNCYQASVPRYIPFYANLMKLPAIFQDLKLLYDFQTIGMEAILFFKMRPKFYTHVFIAINIPCTFFEDEYCK